MEQKESEAPVSDRLAQRKLRPYLIWPIASLLLILIGVGVFFYHSSKKHPTVIDPVPLSIRQTAKFPIYYPDQSKLPADYHLDTASFTASKLVVVYKVNYDNGKQKLVFSVEQKPSSSDIQDFYKTHLPLSSTIDTPIGTATIGAIGQRTVVSLPTTSNAWLLITGPPKIDAAQLKQVLLSLTAAPS